MTSAKKTLVVLVAICALAVAAIEASRAQEKRGAAGSANSAAGTGDAKASAPDAKPAGGQMSLDQFKQLVARMSAPAPEHALLDQLAGEWKFTSRLWVQPGAQPMPASGKSVNTWILGRRFLQSKSTAEGALWTEQLTVYGYDTRHKTFSAWSIDTLGTYSVSANGAYDAAAKTWTLTGEDDEPGQGKVQFKWIVQVVDDTHHTIEIHLKVGAAEWFKQVEARYERTAPPAPSRS